MKGDGIRRYENPKFAQILAVKADLSVDAYSEDASAFRPDTIMISLTMKGLPGPLVHDLENREEFVEFMHIMQVCGHACGWCEKPKE